MVYSVTLVTNTARYSTTIEANAGALVDDLWEAFENKMRTNDGIDFSNIKGIIEIEGNK